jgi:hypothetical protein
MNPLDYLFLNPKQFKAKKDRIDARNRMAGNNPLLMVDQATGFIRTVPGAFQGASGGTNLNLDLTGGAVPPIAITPGTTMIAPGSAEQSQRLLGLQQAIDEVLISSRER